MVLFSVIIPAYNEEKRLPEFLSSLTNSLKEESVEIILVDDGSRDKTAALAGSYPSVKVLKHDKNQGKGAAVRTGVLASKGKYALFIDSDGSIKASEIPGMVKKLSSSDIVIGNRHSKGSKITVKQPLFRRAYSKVLNTLVRALFNLKLNDVLCGFKGFRTEVAKDLFSNLHSKRWLFDVEILYKAKKRGYGFSEIPIEWENKEGSKVNPVLTPIKILFELLRLRIRLK